MRRSLLVRECANARIKSMHNRLLNMTVERISSAGLLRMSARTKFWIAAPTIVSTPLTGILAGEGDKPTTLIVAPFTAPQ
jgi:hypothetical protein